MASYKGYKSVSSAKKAGAMYFMGKEGKKKLAVTKEQLDAWKKRNKGKYKGSALTAWANNKGKDVVSLRPKLRPGSESAGPMMGVMTKAEKAEVDKANKENKIAREQMGGSTDSVKAIAEKALSREEKTKQKYEEDKAASREKRGPSPGEKFNAWFKENKEKYKNKDGSYNNRRAMADWKQKVARTDDTSYGNSKGGMQMKQGRYNKGGMADYRKTGMFYGGMAKKR